MTDLLVKRNRWIALVLGQMLLTAAAAAEPAPLSFMSGCWESRDGEPFVEEHYGHFSGGAFFGHVKMLKEGHLVFWEFLEIRAAADGQLVLTPHPRGAAAKVSFTLSLLEDDQAVFENLEHDFPQHISYRRLANNRLLTRVAGIVDGESVVEEYTTQRVACAVQAR